MKSLKIITISALITLTGCQSAKVITPDEQRSQSKQDLVDIYDFEPKEPLALNDVLSQVLFRNQDVLTKALEADVAQGERIYQNLEYLPQLTASLVETRRNKLALSTSARVGEQPIDGVDTTPSYSRPLDVQDATVNLRWDLLNIFKNYLTSKQKGNAQLIAKANREKAAQNVFRDSMPAYFYAALNQSEGPELRELASRLQYAMDTLCSPLATAETVNDTLAQNCQSALRSHSDILGLLKQLDSADLNLHALLSVNPSVQIPLRQPSYEDPGELNVEVDEMIEMALGDRPEIAVELYKQRNHKIDKSKAYWDILPSIELGYTYNNTDNPFTVNDSWEQESLSVTWNVLSKVVGAPLRAKQAERKYRVANARYRALLITTVTQVELASKAYAQTRQTWINSYQRNIINNRVAAKHHSLYAAGAVSEIAYLISRIDNVRSRLQAKADYVAMVDVLGRVYLSLGIPLTPSLERVASPAELSNAIADQLKELSIISETL